MKSDWFTEPSLFDESPGRARKDDYDTSKAGAANVQLRAGTQKTKLLEAFRQASPKSLTDEQAAILAGIPLTSCYWKRCGELRDLGLIEWVMLPDGTHEMRDGSQGTMRNTSKAVLD